MGLVPGQTGTSMGYLLVALVVLDLGRVLETTRGMHRIHRSVEPLTAGDWGWYVIYPTVSTLVIGVTGLAMARGWPLPVQLLAVGLLGHLVVGVHNSWELADWLATRR
jgi:hypothetical protein